MKSMYVVIGLDGGNVSGGIIVDDAQAADAYQRALLVDAYGEADVAAWERDELDLMGSGDYEARAECFEVLTPEQVRQRIADMAKEKVAWADDVPVCGRAGLGPRADADGGPAVANNLRRGVTPSPRGAR